MMVDLWSKEVEDVGLDRRIDLNLETKVKKTSLQIDGILNEGGDPVIGRSEMCSILRVVEYDQEEEFAALSP